MQCQELEGRAHFYSLAGQAAKVHRRWSFPLWYRRKAFLARKLLRKEVIKNFVADAATQSRSHLYLICSCAAASATKPSCEHFWTARHCFHRPVQLLSQHGAVSA